MHLDRFTIKSQEALQAANTLAANRRNTETAPEHLLAALLEQGEGIVLPILRKLGAQPEAIRADVNAALDGLPTITGGTAEPSTARELIAVLRAAEREAGKLDDDYISTEHVLLALSEDRSKAGEALRRNGAGHDSVLQALEDVRGPHRVTDQSPEDKYQALQKFGRDLTQEAEDGRLDPVIGRGGGMR